MRWGVPSRHCDGGVLGAPPWPDESGGRCCCREEDCGGVRDRSRRCSGACRGGCLHCEGLCARPLCCLKRDAAPLLLRGRRGRWGPLLLLARRPCALPPPRSDAPSSLIQRCAASTRHLPRALLREGATRAALPARPSRTVARPSGARPTSPRVQLLPAAPRLRRTSSLAPTLPLSPSSSKLLRREGEALPQRGWPVGARRRGLRPRRGAAREGGGGAALMARRLVGRVSSSRAPRCCPCCNGAASSPVAPHACGESSRACSR